MIPDADVPYSDGWWLARLTAKLNARPTRKPVNIAEARRWRYGRRDWMDLLWSYMVGEPPLTTTMRRKQEATREFLRMSRANYGALVAEALLDRVQLVGVRTGADGDSAGDDIMRGILADNGAWMSDALTYAFALGEGFAIVGPGEPGSATITGEDPRQVVAEMDPIRPYVARAAMKCYADDLLGEVKHLYLPADPTVGTRDRVMVAVRSARTGQWDWDPTRSGDLPVQGYGVPVVPFSNRFGMGEFETHLDLLDRINNGIADRLWTAKVQAFKQRAIEGRIDVRDPTTGEKIDLNEAFESGPDKLWMLPDGVKIWESAQVDLQPILLAVRDDVKELSAVSRTPLVMFTPDAATGTAEGASLTREGLTFKADERCRRLTPPAVRTARLALAYAGHEDRARGPLQAIWAPTERYSLSQRMQAGAQAKAAGAPLEGIFADVMQLDPETVARWMTQRSADLFFSATTQGQSGGTASA